MTAPEFGCAKPYAGSRLAPPAPGRPSGARDYDPAAVIEEFDRRDRVLSDAIHGWQSRYYQYLHTQTARAVLAALVREGGFPLAGKRILDVGCGAGGWLLEFARWGADPAMLAGLDLNPRRIAHARRRLPLAELHAGDARNLPWPDGEFALAVQFTVFSSILSPAVREEAASEMLRVVRPGGLILSYDLRVDNPHNERVRTVTCEELRNLFPGCRVEVRSVTLAPPLARRIVPLSWMLAIALEKLPLLRTHYLAVIRKPRGASNGRR